MAYLTIVRAAGMPPNNAPFGRAGKEFGLSIQTDSTRSAERRNPSTATSGDEPNGPVIRIIGKFLVHRQLMELRVGLVAGTSRSSFTFISPLWEGSDGQIRNQLHRSRVGFGIGRMVGQRADARCFERAQRTGAKCDDHP